MDDAVSPDLSPNRLTSARRSAWAALAWERLWPLLWPLFAVVVAFLSVSWFGLWPLFSETARLLTLAGFGVAGLVACSPLRHFSAPTSQAVDRRIESHSQLEHRPVTAQTDTRSEDPSANDPFAAALWREHQARMAKGLNTVSSGLPQPAMAARDPYGLRSIAVLILFIAGAAGFGQWGSRIGDAFENHTIAEAVASGRIDAWVTPPAYTNRPPVYLDLTTGEPLINRIPQGSILVVRALDVDAPSLVRDEEGLERALEQNEGDVPTFETVPEAGRALTLRSGESEIATFAFTIIPDEPPSISLVETPKGSNRGALEFSYKVSDDYGVTGAQGVITSLEVADGDAQPLVDAPDIPLPLPRRRAKEGESKTSRDLTAHPWAGGRVAMDLIVTDDADQSGSSGAHEFVLPQRVFTRPLAEALVYERRRLALDMRNRRSVATMLDIITTTHPDELIDDASHFMALRVIYRMVSRNTEKEPLREALDLMWTTALAIEDGDLSAAERRLRDAQERLSEALENGASEEEISKFMAELREAMSDFMRELAEQQSRQSENRQAMQDQNSQILRQNDLEQMMQRIEDLAKSGSRDAARELLQEMQRMMNNLQTAKPNQQQQQNPMTEQMNKLGEMMRQQQQLMDQTFDMQRQQQRQQQDGQQGEQQQGQNQQGEQQGQKPMTAEEFAEAMRKLQEQQGELQKQMHEMQEAMRGMGMEPGEGLSEAGEAMEGAEQQLGQGNTGEATGEQGRALQAMRQGAQQMMQQMQQQGQAGQQSGPNEQGQGQQDARSQRDPLGRESRSDGPQLGDDVRVPGEIDAQRAREILEAIRRRLGESTRPKLELDYLDRLLPSQ